MQKIDSFLVTLNSDDGVRQNGAYLSNVTFNFPSVVRKDSHVERIHVSVQDAQFGCSFYAVHAENSRLNFVYNGVTSFVDIEHGNYNANTLATEIITKLDANDTPFILTVNRTTGQLSFYADGLPLSILATSTIRKIIGLGTENLTSAGPAVTCPYSINLLGVTCLRIASTKLPVTGLSSTGLATTGLLATVPVDSTSGSFGLLSYTNVSWFNPILHATHVTVIDIQIYDQDSVPVDFRGIGWTITLKLDLVTGNQGSQVSPPSNESVQLKALIRTLRTLAENLGNLVSPPSEEPEQQAEEGPAEAEEQQAEAEEEPDVERAVADDTGGDLDILLEQLANNPIDPNAPPEPEED